MSTASDANPDSDDEPTLESPTLDSLWAVACQWVDILTGTFGEPAELASIGLSRRLALKCCNWLWSVEGLVRRVIVAAALAFDLRKLPPPRAKPGAAPAVAAVAAAHAAPRPPGFRLFAFAASPCPASPPRQLTLTEPSRPYAHIPFPADDLLRIGARERSSVGRGEPGETAAAPRVPHPLRRWGRISRWDPDYRGAPNQDPLFTRTSPGPGAPFTSRTSSRPRLPPASALHVLPDLSDWRRVEAEWQRTLPAPHLARRIAALLRIVDQPARWIRRLAWRLKAGNLAARLALQPPPSLRRPRLDRTPPPPLQEELALAHAFLDSS